jgi:hypothetical protein
VRIAPGLTFNLSKRGVSVSAGVRGAHVTVNSQCEVTETVGLPGTGLYYTQRKKLRGGTGATTIAVAIAFFAGYALPFVAGFILMLINYGWP